MLFPSHSPMISHSRSAHRTVRASGTLITLNCICNLYVLLIIISKRYVAIFRFLNMCTRMYSHIENIEHALGRCIYTYFLSLLFCMYQYYYYYYCFTVQKTRGVQWKNNMVTRDSCTDGLVSRNKQPTKKQKQIFF